MTPGSPAAAAAHIASRWRAGASPGLPYASCTGDMYDPRTQYLHTHTHTKGVHVRA
jgi:hypothetical protein